MLEFSVLPYYRCDRYKFQIPYVFCRFGNCTFKTKDIPKQQTIVRNLKLKTLVQQHRIIEYLMEVCKAKAKVPFVNRMNETRSNLAQTFEISCSSNSLKKMQNKSTVFVDCNYIICLDFLNILAKNRPTLLIVKICCKSPIFQFFFKSCLIVIIFMILHYFRVFLSGFKNSKKSLNVFFFKNAF